MTESAVVIFDMGGVLVDNTEFEPKVTERVVREFARHRKITEVEAGRLWVEELALTRGQVEWFSYDFHCQRLGIEGVARSAHEESLHHLHALPGASETLSFLASRARIVIATDATRWVADLKLKASGLDLHDALYSSEEVGVAKLAPAYWRYVNDAEAIDDGPALLVENRLENIQTALSLCRSLKAIHFDEDEHVTAMPALYSPRETSNPNQDLPSLQVADHAELLGLLREFWP